jgi:hypothetical protein
MPRTLAAAGSLVAALALVVVACGAPAAPALTDPTEILTAAVDKSGEAKSVHLELTVSGAVSAEGQSFPLDGTSLEADVDIANENLKATFTVPAFLGLTGELVQIGTDTYFKSSLTGPLYQHGLGDLAGGLPVDPSDLGAELPTDVTADIDALLEKLEAAGVKPTKKDDVQCGTKTCYVVSIALTAEQLAALGAEAGESLPPELGDGSLDIEVRVEQDSQRLAGVTIGLGGGELGNLELDLALSKWDEAVTIEVPPADQIAPAS